MGATSVRPSERSGTSGGGVGECLADIVRADVGRPGMQWPLGAVGERKGREAWGSSAINLRAWWCSRVGGAFES